ncbi:MAG: cytidine deaminase [Bacteroidetes bacterium]|nr:cytidine deaminase [Bacteroidota bacterium]MDA0903979.1 cytidine deaminase [Bacteroidota bacterium]MDA1243159.1 cytidine deaminase [Bacteroidota bacterium]
MVKTREWVSTLEVWNPHELSVEDRALLAEAHVAASKAYAPYSEFYVGGAVRLADGNIVRGSNQENMAYPSGMCGERVAVFAAGAQHPGVTMMAVAIVSPSEKAISEAFMPCGGCRQVLVEAERRQGSPIRVLLQVRDEEVAISSSAVNLVPFAFEAFGLGGTGTNGREG